MNIDARIKKFKFFYKNQSIFYLNKHKLLNWDNTVMNKTIAYMHGYPIDDHNKNLLNLLYEKKNDIQKIWVTHNKMKEYILDKGIDEKKIIKNYISIDIEKFDLINENKKNSYKNFLKIPKKNIVIGSFQKDGVGWGEGLKPKLEKGPDILIKILSKLKKEYQDLTVLLTGPSRGYVINELKKENIHYIHHNTVDYNNLKNYYSVLDFYLVTSRQEGGPRAILESMALGIPVISSKVGQATELIKNGENGFLTDIGNVNDYFEIIDNLIKSKISSQFRDNCRKTAVANSYSAQKNKWKTFFDGIIDY